jgi:hypothetical protein
MPQSRACSSYLETEEVYVSSLLRILLARCINTNLKWYLYMSTYITEERKKKRKIEIQAYISSHNINTTSALLLLIIYWAFKHTSHNINTISALLLLIIEQLTQGLICLAHGNGLNLCWSIAMNSGEVTPPILTVEAQCSSVSSFVILPAFSSFCSLM